MFILKNRQIKLSPLPAMDDQEEKRIADIPEFAKYCFISSWTDCEAEKISLWNMYTRNMTGVRIKLHKLPFELYQYDIQKYGHPIDIMIDGGSVYPKEWLDNTDSYTFIPLSLNEFLIKVEYTEDEKLINPCLLDCHHRDKISFDFNKLGKYKREEWRFEDEVRYRMIYLPVTFKDNSDEKIKQALVKMEDLPFKECFFKIKEDYFRQLEITTGPKMSEGDKEILRLMVKEYCPTASIVPSKFTGKIM